MVMMMKRLKMISLLAVLSVCMNASAVQSSAIHNRMLTLGINPSTMQEACVYTGITASFAFMMSTFAAERYGKSADRWEKRYAVSKGVYDTFVPQKITQSPSKVGKAPDQETPGASALSLCEQEKNYVQRMYTAARYGTYISAAIAIGSFAAATLLNEQ